jgi:hypothetical protein
MAEGRWKLSCPQCKIWFNLPDYIRLQINIPQDDDDHRPITRREARNERYKICAVMSVQGILIAGLISIVIWGYMNLLSAAG